VVRCLKNSNGRSGYLKAVGSFNSTAAIRLAIRSSQDRAIANGHCVMYLRTDALAVHLREHKN